jgi:hypothetical protein
MLVGRTAHRHQQYLQQAKVQIRLVISLKAVHAAHSGPACSSSNRIAATDTPLSFRTSMALHVEHRQQPVPSQQIVPNPSSIAPPVLLAGVGGVDGRELGKLLMGAAIRHQPLRRLAAQGFDSKGQQKSSSRMSASSRSSNMS